jgi:hypothetical protein
VRLLGVTLTTLTAEILAFKLVVAAVIETLPERQRAAADNALKSMRHPAGLENASFAHFSTGEEATHTMLKSQTEILGMVSKLAAASGVTPPTTPP